MIKIEIEPKDNLTFNLITYSFNNLTPKEKITEIIKTTEIAKKYIMGNETIHALKVFQYL